MCLHTAVTADIVYFWKNDAYWCRETHHCHQCGETVTKEYIICL